MGRVHLLLLVSLLLASGLYVVPRTIPSAHSDLVGEVCIAKGGNTNCPVAPPLLNSTVRLPPPQLRVAIAINGSAGLLGFDITLLTDHTILKPAGIDLTGTVLLGTPVVLLDCIAGVRVSGSACSPGTDNIDTIHLSATSAIGKPNTLAPTTGLLFTAIYNVSGTTASSPIGFQTGCSRTSVPNVCVTVPNGTPTPNIETIQTGAKFTDVPYFDIQDFNVASVTVPEVTTDNSLTLNITSINNFAGTVAITPTVSPSPAPTISLSPSSVKVDPINAQNFTSVTIFVPPSVSPNNYTLTFTATSGTLPPNNLTITLRVPLPDFTISSSPTTLEFNVTSSSSSTIAVSGLANTNFTGTVNLKLSIPFGLNATLANTSLNINKGSTATTTLTVTSTVSALYQLNIIGTSGSLTHTLPVVITVLDFTMHAVQGPLTLPQGRSGIEQVNFGALFVYNVSLTLTTSVSVTNSSGSFGPSAGVTVSCNPSKVNVTGSGTSETISSSFCRVSAIQTGNYTVSIIATHGSLSHAVTFTVQVQGPDFTIVTSTAVQTLTVGKSATVQIVLTREVGFNGTINLGAQFPNGINPPSPPSASFNVTFVTLNATYPVAGATVTITSTTSAQTGIYYLVLSASSQVTHKVTVTIVITTTTSPHDLAVYSVSSSPTSATVGSTVTITIVVQNLGTLSENSSIIAIAGDLTVGMKNFTNLTPAANFTVTLPWNTSGFNPGAYIVAGQVLGVPGETVLANNILRSSTPVTLTAANTSLLQSPYFQPAIIAALVAIVGILGLVFLQARRKTQAR